MHVSRSVGLPGLNRGNLRFERAEGEREQRRYVDAQRDTTRRSDGDADSEGDEAIAPATPATPAQRRDEG